MTFLLQWRESPGIWASAAAAAPKALMRNENLLKYAIDANKNNGTLKTLQPWRKDVRSRFQVKVSVDGL
jgi:hypothetical protein